MAIKDIALPPWLYKMALNVWPCIRRTGGRVVYIAPDFSELVVRLKFNWQTRNLVGTIFGGSLYASTDPFFMLMLMRILGPDFVVWDKGCSFRFKRPAKETLHARFLITPEMLEAVKGEVAKNKEHTFTWRLEYKDQAGNVYVEFDKVLYVATKDFYKEKLKARTINK